MSPDDPVQGPQAMRSPGIEPWAVAIWSEREPPVFLRLPRTVTWDGGTSRVS